MEQEMTYCCPECRHEQEVKNFTNFKCEECHEAGSVEQCDTCSNLLWGYDEDIMCEECISYRLSKN